MKNRNATARIGVRIDGCTDGRTESRTEGRTDGCVQGLVADGADGADGAAAARKARFGTLPERVRPEETVEVRAVTPNDPARHGCDPERSWTSFSCLAVDLGL
ncbi:hypothetical protein [Streptomyces hilarionis]|uniref:hypothetical protein n=1 Tax=Streptomyces hilarionis TaxID=2839954 RepID=UPI00211A422E|nr:hypothetical protein [Streptomyces hilarionis]MCQ9135833.1 hypothetical protein [Streptomyces hilarionis]